MANIRYPGVIPRDAAGLVVVDNAGGFPNAVGGVITLADDVTYLVTSAIDLSGDRIVCGDRSGIIGTVQDISSITSTGLGADALITSAHRVTLRDITIHDVTLALDLDASDPDDFLVWSAVAFTDCTDTGRIQNYSSVIMAFCSLDAAPGLVFDGTLGTVAINDTFISGAAGKTTITIPATATITRRFRTRYSAVITPATGTALDVSTSATIPDESYILTDCNFSGDGARIVGVQFDDNKAMFDKNIGIDNSRTFANYYMSGNLVDTPITQGVPAKVSGTTTENSINQRFSHSDNRATYTGALTRDFEVDIRAGMSANSNNILHLYVAVNGTAILEPHGAGTSNSSGRADGITVAGVVELSTGDYVEAFVSNESASVDIDVTSLDVVISEL